MAAKGRANGESSSWRGTDWHCPRLDGERQLGLQRVPTMAALSLVSCCSLAHAPAMPPSSAPTGSHPARDVVGPGSRW